jgi:hypothetical protein
MRALVCIAMMTAIPAALRAQPRGRDEPRDSLVVHAAEARMRVASGTLVRGGDRGIGRATLATDLIRFARGFRWKTPTRVETRGSAAQSPNGARCLSLSEAESVVPRGGKAVAVYLDGSRLPGGLEMVNRMVPVSDVLAVEAYPDVLAAPSMWRTNDACAVVAFWTRGR